MNRSLLGFLITLVAVSFLGGLLLTAFSDRVDAVQSAGADSYSYSLVGYRALARYLERSGLPVVRRRLERELPPEPGLVVVIAEPDAEHYAPPSDSSAASAAIDSLRHTLGLSPDAPDSTVVAESSAVAESTAAADSSSADEEEDDWWEDYRRTYRATTLQLLPKYVPVASLKRPDWVEAMPLQHPDYVATVLEESGADSARLVRPGVSRLHCATAWGESLWVVADTLQAIVPGASQRALVWHDSLALVVTWQDVYGDTNVLDHGRVVLVTDPDLLNNQGLGRADHARLVRRLFERELQARRVVFDESGHHALSALLARELVRFPLVLLFTHFVLLVALAGWGLSRRFGDARKPRPRAADRSALVTAAANLLAGAGDPAEMLSLYWDQAVREVLGRFEGLQRTPWHERLPQLARIEAAHRRPALSAELEHEVELLRRLDRAPLTRILAIARRIHHWQGELLHER